MVVVEFKNFSFLVILEFFGNFGEEYMDVLVSGKIVGVVEIDFLFIIIYQIEVERKGFKVKSKIYDIFR